MRVLVVEDERKLAQVVESALQAEHYDVVIAATGEDGFFRANAEVFDLIVLDLMLPGRSGLEILQTLRQRRVETPVLILTARDGVDDRVLGLDLGADDYLVKPFALPELLARIRALFRRGRPSDVLRLKAASAARRITAERLHERLSVPNQQDEIGRLAGVINDTFARLESSFAQLRRFTADASHELRTPLAVIRGIGEMGLKETRTPGEYKESLDSMLEEVDRLTTLVDTLLRLSHGDAGTVRLSPESLDLGQLARDVVSSLGLLAEERQQRVRVDAAETVSITADRLVLREAITNVVDNAIKYSPRGSAIDIRVYAEGDRAIVAVADEGPGIAAEHRERIFDRFFRVDEARSRDAGGTGLGLAIARWAIEANGGQISVENRPSGGSCFRIALPVRTPAVTEHHEDSNQRMEGYV